MSDASEANTKYFGLCTKNGYVKENNEDSALFLSGISTNDDRTTKFICASLADGVGGRPSGEIASKISVQVFSEKMLGFSLSASVDPKKALLDGITAANMAIMELNYGEDRGMATTFVGTFVYGKKLYYITSGDSSVFLAREGKKITVLNELHRDLETGRLTSCLGLRESFITSAGSMELEIRDRICLVSDGITDLVSLKEIGSVIQSCKNDENCADEMVNRALEHGGRDNATALIYTYT